MRTENGFTLIELMLVVALIAIIAGIGIPSFQSMILNSRLNSSANGILAALQFARSEAVTQRAVISVCPANADKTDCADSTDWSTGVLIMKAAVKLREIPITSTQITITGSLKKISYNPDGTTTAASFTVSDGKPQPRTRQVKVNTIGQACAGSTCS